jgi:hypothetical protein
LIKFEAAAQRLREEIYVSRKMTDLERLQCIEEICVLTNRFRQAFAAEKS